MSNTITPTVFYRTLNVEGLEIFYREAGPRVAAPVSAPAQSPAPASYTPPHLAERIRAEQAALEARGVTNGERKRRYGGR
jgi:hypothetical protein